MDTDSPSKLVFVALLEELMARSGVELLLMAPGETRVLVEGRLCLLLSGTGRPFAAIAAQPSRLTRALGPLPGPIRLLVVGGDLETLPVLRGLKDRLGRPDFELGWIEQAEPAAPQLRVPEGELSGVFAECVEAVLARDGLPRAPVEEIEGRCRAALEQSQERRGKARNFLAALRGRQPRAIYGLGLLFGVMFALQWLWGGQSNPLVMARMGAAVHSAVHAGQWWRLLGSAVLHGGLLHFGMNTFVLIRLGDFLERLIGARRFFALWVLSALAGALASSFGGEIPVMLGLTSGRAAMSVGASGGLWGMLGASAAIAYRRGDLPPQLAARARRVATTNLLINIFISFLPQVDALAHFGGGLAGAALVYLGVVRPTLPGAAPPPRARLSQGLAIGGGALLLASIALSLAFGRPWALGRAPGWQQVALGPLSLPAPAGLVVREGDAPAPSESVEVGWIGADPVYLGYSLQPLERPLGKGEAGPLVDLMLDPEGLEGFARVIADERQETPLGTLDRTLFRRGEDGLQLERGVLLGPEWLLIYDLALQADAPEAWQGVPDEIYQRLGALTP